MVDSPKTYENVVEDGLCIERLLNNADFQCYRKMVLDVYVKLFDAIRNAPASELPALQGALIQQHLMVRHPERVLKLATQLVTQRRAEVDNDT